MKTKLRMRMHDPVPSVGKWLGAVLRGHFQYYGVPRNSYALSAFRLAVMRLWSQVPSRRSQKERLSWARMSRLCKRWLPTVRVMHPYPEQRLCV